MLGDIANSPGGDGIVVRAGLQPIGEPVALLDAAVLLAGRDRASRLGRSSTCPVTGCATAVCAAS
ncbi:hypothetical protein ACUN7V_21145 [Quadrisphaera oryzae]|uniref:hypothetical protein n=1 Tax=Quadrisphaera TaxID=317661 RepID=UPI0016451DCD|nr:hypothetical protein [Quadrisphaera sp. RL12-1S]MBC3762930.1 hypothetical protein [Quadrisphaera sp. RL12-1S]